MKAIIISEFLTTQGCHEFMQVQSLGIENQSIGQGGFGTVYRLQQVNNRPISTPCIVKLLNGPDAGRGLQTIQQLQQKIARQHQTFQRRTQQSVFQIAALQCFPMCSFTGTMGEKGYLTLYLGNEFKSFEDVLMESKEYAVLDWKAKLQLAYQFVEGFIKLREMGFLWADVNPDNFFVSISKLKLCFIDLDGGTVTDQKINHPSTIGKLGEWMPYEYIEAMNQGGNDIRIRVDLYSEHWGVALGVFYLLFLCHPFFFLSDLGPHTVRNYLAAYRWPEPDHSIGSQPTEVEQMRQSIADLITKFAPFQFIQQQMQQAFNKGVFTPSARPSHYLWLSAIEQALRYFQPPKIKYFLKNAPQKRGEQPSVFLSWEVRFAQRVEITEFGVVPVSGCTRIPVTKLPKDYTIEAIGYGGSAKEQLHVEVTPPSPVTPQISFKNQKQPGTSVILIQI